MLLDSHAVTYVFALCLYVGGDTVHKCGTCFISEVVPIIAPAFFFFFYYMCCCLVQSGQIQAHFFSLGVVWLKKHTQTHTHSHTLQSHLVCWTMTSFQEKEEKITWQPHLCNQLFMWLEARGRMSNASGYRLNKPWRCICKYTCMQRVSRLFCSYVWVFMQAFVTSLGNIEWKNNWENWYRERERQSRKHVFSYLKRGRYQICHHSKEGWGEREREWERTDGEGVFLCGWVTQREGGGV